MSRGGIPTTPQRNSVVAGERPRPSLSSSSSPAQEMSRREVTPIAPVKTVALSHCSDCEAVRNGNPQRNNNVLGCVWEDGEGSFKVTPLYCACRSGRFDLVKSCLKTKVAADGVQEEKRQQTPLHAAQLSGDVNIVALLLLAGAKPRNDKYNFPPSKVYSQEVSEYKVKNLAKLWSTFDKSGYDAIRIEYPQLYQEITGGQQNNRNDSTVALDAIDNYIKNNPSLPNIVGKVRKEIPSTGGDELLTALEILLRSFNWKFDDGKSLYSLYQEYIESLVKDDDLTASAQVSHKIGYIQATAQIFNVNISVLLYNSETKAVKLRHYHVNKYKKSQYPYIYLSFNGYKYDPIIEDPSLHQTNVTHETLFGMIESPSVGSEFFAAALASFDMTKINNIFKFKPKDREFFLECSILYFACRCGRTDLIQILLSQEGISIDGVQESYDGNTPLHVASWRGHTNIVAMLLFSGATTKILNKKKEKPSLWDTNLPQKTRDELNKLWSSYEKGADHFKNEFKNYVIVERPEVTQTTSLTASAVPIIHTSGPVSVDQLCSIVDAENPPTLEEFKEIMKRFFSLDKKQINHQSAAYKCTPLYCACRKGHYHIVKELLTISDLRKTGSQESYTLTENTPLHVANWRGHTRVVALLLLNGVPLEHKSGGSKAKPNNPAERNFTLPQEKRNLLSTLYQAFEKNDNETLKTIAEHYDAEYEGFSASKPLPLWAVIGLPKEELPPQYLKLDYIWYSKTDKSSDKFVLVDLTTCSHLNALYQRYLSNPKQVLWKTNVPVPPSTGLFSDTKPFSSVEWTVDFTDMRAQIGTKTILLGAIARSKTWYYSTQPKIDALYVPFPNKTNNTISSAYTSNMPAIQFPYLIDKSFFARPVICLVNFDRKECNMTPHNQNMTTHKILIEDEYNQRTYWEPEGYLPRTLPKYKHDEITMEDVKDNDEFQKIASFFYLTMPQYDKNNTKINEIVRIRRLFYPAMKDRFEQELAHAQNVHSGEIRFRNSIKYTRLLWHGTGGTDPMVVARGGWKINFASNKNLWGRGAYFASDASYSAGYSYQDKSTGNRMMYLAQVITGLSLQCYENHNIVEPPKGYNSILGYRHGSWVYVVYDSIMAYPTYLVEWSEKSS